MFIAEDYYRRISGNRRRLWDEGVPVQPYRPRRTGWRAEKNRRLFWETDGLKTLFSAGDLLLDIKYGCAVENIQPRHLDSISLHCQHLQFGNGDGIRPYRAAGGKDAVQPP